LTVDSNNEWLEADQLGGFAMGTAGLVRTRRYHALLCCATAPPTGRVALVAGVEAWVDGGDGPVHLSSQAYGGGVVWPDGCDRILDFRSEPWPRWRFDVGGGDEIEHAVFCHRPSGEVVLRWRLVAAAGSAARRLTVRPLLACRDYHGLGRENSHFCFDAQVVGGNAAWQPYGDRPAVTALSNGRYSHDPSWYRNFYYAEEEARGLDCAEDLGSPGVFSFEPDEDAVIVLRAGRAPYGDAASIAADHERAERPRRADPIERAVDAYLVRRGRGLTVVAGYPWFTDWGRDTFIAVRGLCLAPGRPPRRLEQGRQVLLAWADAVHEIGAGMVPNRFSDARDGSAAFELNAVDASLWFVVAAGELLERCDLEADERERISGAVLAIIEAFARGAQYRIRCDDDGLIAAGQPGVQLTWMDAKVGDWVVTPRIGKPVEIQALWINALAVAERLGAAQATALRERATASFLERFPLTSGALCDVVDADHVAGVDDRAFRPNQIFAVGGLPLPLIEGPAARRLVDLVEEKLWTPVGPRSLDPDDPAYCPRYQGGVRERDGAYHQGTVWPWLAGPFIEAWVRARGGSAEARREALRRFVEPLWAQLETAGLGHVSEIADGDSPHILRGAPFQAWSLAELLRARLLCEET
jgi:predicted glycogen debranching enzyme